MRSLIVALATLSLYTTALRAQDTYTENLLIRPLPDGKVLSHFEFSTSASIDLGVASNTTTTVTSFHTSLLPRSLSSIVRAYDVEEVHLTLTSGRWDHARWKDPLTHGSPSGGEIAAWLSEYHDDTEETITQKWTGLTNALGGLFCSSLNNLDSRVTTSPSQTFFPAHKSSRNQPFFHALLPLERPCTENLTPFISLLPCRAQAGLAELLNPQKLFDANWQKLGIHAIRNLVSGELRVRLEMEVVQDPVRMTLSGGSQPRREFSLESLFGRPIQRSCPAADASALQIDLSSEVADSGYNIQPREAYSLSADGNSAVFDSQSAPKPLSVEMTWPVVQREGFQYPSSYSPAPMLFDRINAGFGLERGYLGIEIRNSLESSVSAVWLEEWPWWIKVFMHTLTITVDGEAVTQDTVLRTMRYSQAEVRHRPTVIEAGLRIPSSSIVRITLDIDKAYLRYTDYPPDAMRGLDVPSGVLLVKGQQDRKHRHDRRLYTPSTLLDMPTPDFSMPYNVIIMTSTVMALFFGSVFNLLTRSWMIVDLEDDTSETKPEDSTCTTIEEQADVTQKSG